MNKTLIITLATLLLNACATAKMAIAPELANNSLEYKITETPGLFDDRLKFGPYLATNIDKSWMRSSSTSLKSYKNEKRSQTYAYDFKGAGRWKASCKMEGKGQTLGRVEFGVESALNCSFHPVHKTLKSFTFRLGGPSLVQAEGEFSVGDKTYRVEVVNKIQGSSLSMGVPTGYTFYAGDRIIAGVSRTNSEGPVWFHQRLPDAEKDHIGIVMVALILFKEKGSELK